MWELGTSTDKCEEPLPWKEVAMGGQPELKGFLPGYGGDNMKRPLTLAIVSQNKYIMQQLFGNRITAELECLGWVLLFRDKVPSNQ